MSQLLILFATIIATVVAMRIFISMILVWHILPPKLLSNINGILPHHFVWGNCIIVATAVMVVGLGVNPASTGIAVLLGFGLGLVLDEFPLWVGNVGELSRNVAIIPGAIPAVVIFELTLIFLIILQSLNII